jgi:2'-5' RNA ligase
MPRLFIAVWPPDDVLDLVAGLDRPVVPGLRWTGRDQWHVTLRFLGQVPDVGPVVEALAASGPPPATAVLGPAVGRFAQKILHVPVEGLDDVAGAVVRATSRLGRPPEDRPFQGHLTLARVAKGPRVDLRRFAGAALQARWTVDFLCLVESRLSPAGARYQVLERFPVV